MSNPAFFKTNEGSMLYIYLTNLLIKNIDEVAEKIKTSDLSDREKIELMLELSTFALEQERENVKNCINVDVIYTTIKGNKAEDEKPTLN